MEEKTTNSNDEDYLLMNSLTGPLTGEPEPAEEYCDHNEGNPK